MEIYLLNGLEIDQFSSVSPLGMHYLINSGYYSKNVSEYVAMEKDF